MANNKLANKAASPFDCQICFETYTSTGEKVPVMIPCGHTSCRGCLRKNECPFCRKTFSTNVADLPTNFALIPPDTHSNAHFDLARVRDMAKRASLQETYFNEASRVISFAPLRSRPHQAGAAWGLSGGRLNVYYTTRTVGTCLDHPDKGKTQLFRSAVSDELLLELMYNPRAHTGVGYHHGSPKAAKLTPLEAEASPRDEEAELGAHAQRLEAQLAAHMAAYIAPYQNALQDVQQSLSLLKRKREEDEEQSRARRREAEAELQRAQEQITREADEARAAAEAEHKRAEDRRAAIDGARRERGDRYLCSMNAEAQSAFFKKAGTRDTFKTIETLALTPRGFFFCRESGDSYWSGLCEGLADRLVKERKNVCGMITYLACSPDGQNYYCKLKDGQFWWSGGLPDGFSAAVRCRRRSVAKVALGCDENSWLVMYSDGSVASGSLPYKLGNILRSRDPRLPGPTDISLGPEETWFVRFKDGSTKHVLPANVTESIDSLQLGYGGRVTSVAMVEGGGHFIRHT